MENSRIGVLKAFAEPAVPTLRRAGLVEHLFGKYLNRCGPEGGAATHHGLEQLV